MFQLATLYTLLIVLLAGIATERHLTPAATVGLWALLFLGSMTGRAIARWVARGLTPRERCLVIGSPEQAARVREQFDRHESAHAKVIAHLPFGGFDLHRRPQDLGPYIAARGIDRVIICQSESHGGVLEAVRFFKENDLKVSVLPNLLEVVGSSVEFDEIHGTTLLGVRSFGLSRSSTLLKRGFDLVGAALLTVGLSPLLGAIAIAIKLDTRGPVLFRQTRIGRDGKRFTMVKFRTMVDGADGQRDELLDRNQTQGLFKLADDPRVTRVGRLLRSTSLDELPQLLNVITGEMSLIGPRPLVVDEDEQVEGWHRRRLHLKPGITGAWQIMGNTRVPLQEMVSMDYLYIVNWSLWSDVKILLRTVSHVARRRGL